MKNKSGSRVWFSNMRWYLADPNTGLMEVRFMCSGCGREISEENLASYTMPVENGNIAKIWEAEFWCKKCNPRRLEEAPENKPSNCVQLINNQFYLSEAETYPVLWEEIRKSDANCPSAWYTLSEKALLEYQALMLERRSDGCTPQ